MILLSTGHLVQRSACSAPLVTCGILLLAPIPLEWPLVRGLPTNLQALPPILTSTVAAYGYPPMRCSLLVRCGYRPQFLRVIFLYRPLLSLVHGSIPVSA